MILKLILAVGIVFFVFLAWVLVQHITRIYSERHPEFGPHREDGGCGEPDRDCSGCSLLIDGCASSATEKTAKKA